MSFRSRTLFHVKIRSYLHTIFSCLRCTDTQNAIVYRPFAAATLSRKINSALPDRVWLWPYPETGNDDQYDSSVRYSRKTIRRRNVKSVTKRGPHNHECIIYEYSDFGRARVHDQYRFEKHARRCRRQIKVTRPTSTRRRS